MQRFPFQLPLVQSISPAKLASMKFFGAIFVFVLFAFFISWGIIELLKGSPWLLLASLGVFFGTFVKFGCLSH